MTPQQRKAIAAPCYLAAETLQPRFRSTRGLHTEVLTINAGYE